MQNDDSFSFAEYAFALGSKNLCQRMQVSVPAADSTATQTQAVESSSPLAVFRLGGVVTGVVDNNGIPAAVTDERPDGKLLEGDFVSYTSFGGRKYEVVKMAKPDSHWPTDEVAEKNKSVVCEEARPAAGGGLRVSTPEGPHS
jgi:hypothetical protein